MYYKTSRVKKIIVLIAIVISFIFIYKFKEDYRKKKLKEKLAKVARAYLTENEGFEFYDEEVRVTYINHHDSLTIFFSYSRLELTKYNHFLDARVYRINKNDFGVRELKIYRDPHPSNVRDNRKGPDTDDYYW